MDGIINDGQGRIRLRPQCGGQRDNLTAQEEISTTGRSQQHVGVNIAKAVVVVVDRQPDIRRAIGNGCFGKILAPDTITHHPRIGGVGFIPGRQIANANGEIGDTRDTRSRSGHVGNKGSGNDTQIAVSADERDIQRLAVLVHRVTAVGKLNIARSGSRGTDEAGDVAARMSGIAGTAAAHPEETTTDNYIASRFVGNGISVITLVAGGIKGGIVGIGIVVMVHQAGKLIVSRVHETGIQRTIRKHTRHAHAPGLVVRGEIAANQNVAIRLHGDGIDLVGNSSNRIVGSAANTETQIQGAIRI